jgi:N-acetylglucosamine-6-phosphate deacetylase
LSERAVSGPGDSATLIRGARLVDRPEAEPTSLLLSAGRIVAIGSEADATANARTRRIDAGGLMAAAGFIDLQINGAFGNDFTADPASIWAVGARLAETGVTSFLPTIVSSPPETIAAARATLEGGPVQGYAGAMPLGLHVEGPFLSPEKAGAHNPAYLCPPDRGAAANWSRANGILMATLAPELPGALDLVADLVSRGVVVSAGHSQADHEQGAAAIDAGVRYATHLFNAMPSIGHREPGLAAALLLDPRVTVGLIPDGVHVAPAMVELVWRLAGPGRVSIVTDAMAALGMPPGGYPLADREIAVDVTAARTSDGRLAGSVITIAQGLGNIVAFTGCPTAEAIATVTSTPARLLGLPDRGALVEGAIADVVLLSADLTVEATFVAGRGDRG